MKKLIDTLFKLSVIAIAITFIAPHFIHIEGSMATTNVTIPETNLSDVQLPENLPEVSLPDVTIPEINVEVPDVDKEDAADAAKAVAHGTHSYFSFFRDLAEKPLVKQILGTDQVDETSEALVQGFVRGYGSSLEDLGSMACERIMQ